MYVNMTEIKGRFQVTIRLIQGPPNSGGVLGVIGPVPLPTAASLAVHVCRAPCWSMLRERHGCLSPELAIWSEVAANE